MTTSRFDAFFNKSCKLYDLCSSDQKKRLDPLINTIKSYRDQGVEPEWSDDLSAAEATINSLYNKLLAN